MGTAVRLFPMLALLMSSPCLAASRIGTETTTEAVIPPTAAGKGMNCQCDDEIALIKSLEAKTQQLAESAPQVDEENRCSYSDNLNSSAGEMEGKFEDAMRSCQSKLMSQPICLDTAKSYIDNHLKPLKENVDRHLKGIRGVAGTIGKKEAGATGKDCVAGQGKPEAGDRSRVGLDEAVKQQTAGTGGPGKPAPPKVISDANPPVVEPGKKYADAGGAMGGAAGKETPPLAQTPPRQDVRSTAGEHGRPRDVAPRDGAGAAGQIVGDKGNAGSGSIPHDAMTGEPMGRKGGGDAPQPPNHAAPIQVPQAQTTPNGRFGPVLPDASTGGARTSGGGIRTQAIADFAGGDSIDQSSRRSGGGGFLNSMRTTMRSIGSAMGLPVEAQVPPVNAGASAGAIAEANVQNAAVTQNIAPASTAPNTGSLARSVPGPSGAATAAHGGTNGAMSIPSNGGSHAASVTHGSSGGLTPVQVSGQTYYANPSSNVAPVMAVEPARSGGAVASTGGGIQPQTIAGGEANPCEDLQSLACKRWRCLKGSGDCEMPATKPDPKKGGVVVYEGEESGGGGGAKAPAAEPSFVKQAFNQLTGKSTPAKVEEKKPAVAKATTPATAPADKPTVAAAPPSTEKAEMSDPDEGGDGQTLRGAPQWLGYLPKFLRDSSMIQAFFRTHGVRSIAGHRSQIAQQHDDLFGNVNRAYAVVGSTLHR